jgi:hypothetical protein
MRLSIRSTHETRNAALASALSTAQDMWNGQRTPCECLTAMSWHDTEAELFSVSDFCYP